MIVIEKYLLMRSVTKRLNEMKLEDTEDPVLYYRVRNETERIIRESVCDSLAESKWVFVNPNTDTMECEKCRYNIPSSELATPHCPWCGRYMIDWDEICEVECDEKEEDANEQ